MHFNGLLLAILRAFKKAIFMVLPFLFNLKINCKGGNYLFGLLKKIFPLFKSIFILFYLRTSGNFSLQKITNGHFSFNILMLFRLHMLCFYISILQFWFSQIFTIFNLGYPRIFGSQLSIFGNFSLPKITTYMEIKMKKKEHIFYSIHVVNLVVQSSTISFYIISTLKF